jgi:hypothetical protein
MVNDAEQRIKNLSDNDTGLFQHMITAFWHGFGIANGLYIKKEDIETVHYAKGSPCTAYRVKAEVMQEKLADYLKWLEHYKASWGTNKLSCSPYEKEAMYNPLHKSRLPIMKMIELLQV